MYRLVQFMILLINLAFAMNAQARHQQGATQRDLAAARYLRSTSLSGELRSFVNDKSWLVLPLSGIEKALHVPSQPHGREALRSWSCGPNSSARALRLIGKDFCLVGSCDHLTGEAVVDAYESFARLFPKSIGYPGTNTGAALSLGVTLPAIAGLTQFASAPQKAAIFAGLVLTGLSPYIIGYMNGNAGAPPEWMATHLKEIGATKGFDAIHQMGTSFPSILLQIKERIKDKNPVIPLVVIETLAWHYFVIIGFSDARSQVLIMDTDAMILRVSFHDLETLMNVGYLPDDQISAYLLASLVSRISKLGVYNFVALSPHSVNK